MIQGQYEVKPYGSQYFNGAVDVLQYLWGANVQQNQTYFNWKYEKNPYADSPLGVVAIYRGEVVGFRGYFATRWYIPSIGYKLTVLSPGDTCVHPDHRKKGLSVFMGEFASRLLQSNYRVFLNLSGSKSSVPGYLRLGFYPMYDKSYLSRYTLFGLFTFLATAKRKSTKVWDRIEETSLWFDSEHIAVSRAARPREMAALIAGENYKYKKLLLLQDERFFRWRYSNEINKYIFFYYYKDKQLTGYIVVRLSENGHRAYIVDFTESSLSGLSKLLPHIISTRYFKIISIPNVSLDKSVLEELCQLGFSSKNLLRKINILINKELPILVRPTNINNKASDWFIEGLDVRKIDNWKIKGICSDGF